MKDLAGRTVLLTGATGGIGHALARALAGAGAHVVLSGRRGDVLEALAAELGAQVAVADLAEPGAPRALAAAHPDVDVLVANAALPGSGRLEGYTAEQVDRVLDVNLRAPLQLTHALLPAMLGRGAGHLVYISSLSGKAATTGTALYSATKYGLRGFATSLRADLHGSGVGVSAVFPGFISDAGMFADAGVELPPGVGTRTPEQVARATLRAIRRNRGEVDVAPLGLRLGSLFGAVAPELSATVARRLGSERIAAQMEAAQSVKR